MTSAATLTMPSPAESAAATDRPERIGLNPVFGLAACLVIAAGALSAGDPVTPAVLLVPVLALAAMAPHPARVALRAAPLGLGAAGVGLSNALLAPGPGFAVRAGLAAALRVLAVGLPGLLLLASVDPTDLADALIQQARVPARPALGALAALRLLPLLQEEWRMLGLAQRARGRSGGGNPVGAAQLALARVFGLLVATVRRASQLATAMDARGFDAGVPRTSARRSRVRPGDVLVLVGAAALVAVATGVSVALGTWRPLL